MTLPLPPPQPHYHHSTTIPHLLKRHITPLSLLHYVPYYHHYSTTTPAPHDNTTITSPPTTPLLYHHHYFTTTLLPYHHHHFTTTQAQHTTTTLPLRHSKPPPPVHHYTHKFMHRVLRIRTYIYIYLYLSRFNGYTRGWNIKISTLHCAHGKDGTSACIWGAAYPAGLCCDSHGCRTAACCTFTDYRPRNKLSCI